MLVGKKAITPMELEHACKAEGSMSQKLSLVLFHGSWNNLDVPKCREFLEYLITSYFRFLYINLGDPSAPSAPSAPSRFV